MYSWSVEDTYEQCKCEAVLSKTDTVLGDDTISAWYSYIQFRQHRHFLMCGTGANQIPEN